MAGKWHTEQEALLITENNGVFESNKCQVLGGYQSFECKTNDPCIYSVYECNT